MAWIKSHQDLRDHPKTRKLAHILGISKPAAIGHLQCLWWWTLDYAEDGDLSRFDMIDIALGAEWEGDPDTFFDAMTKAGFIDMTPDSCEVHDWEDYAGTLIRRRQSDKERKRTKRGADSAQSPASNVADSASDQQQPTEESATCPQHVRADSAQSLRHVSYPEKSREEKRRVNPSPSGLGDARGRALSPPEQAIPVPNVDPGRFDRRFSKPAPFTLLAALCDELGVNTDDLSKTDRGRQEAIARKLIADGTTADDVRRMVRWLQGQAWVTGGIDLGLIQKQRDKWVLAGKPDAPPALQTTAPRTDGAITSLADLDTYFGDDDDTANTQDDLGDPVADVAPEWDYPGSDPGIHAGASGRGPVPDPGGSGGMGARGEMVSQTG